MQLKGSRRVRCDIKHPLNYQLGFISQGGTSASIFDGLYYPYDIYAGKIRFRKVDPNGTGSGAIVDCYWNSTVWFFSNYIGSISAGSIAPTTVDYPWQVGGYTSSNIVTRKDRLFY